MEQIRFDADRCVMCGAVVEEGRWVCTSCEQKVNAAPKQSPVRSLPQKDTAKKFRWFCRKKRDK